MNEIRKLEKYDRRYIKLLNQKPEKAKEFCNEYLEDLNELMDFTNKYLDYIYQEYEKWCNASVVVFDMPTNNIFQKAIRGIAMYIVNIHLNSLSGKISRLHIVKADFEFIQPRFNQFKHLCSMYKQI